MKKIFTTTLFLASLLTASAQYGSYVGGDISLIPSYEASKTVYLDENKAQIPDVMKWMKQKGWNTFRVRLFVDPKQKSNTGSTDYAVIQNLDYVKTLGKRIKDAGANFMLDIHYSDTYVDATHIQSPAAWKSLTKEQKAEKMYSYTKEVLTSLKEYGAQPDLVQVGNEIMYGILDVKVHPYADNSDDWTTYLSLLDNGCKAVREVCPQAKIIIHTDRPTNTAYNKFYYGKLVDAKIPFDVIGLSYYPFWHGWLDAHPANYNDGLANALTKLATDFPDKKVQIVETAYNFQYWPTSGVNYNTQSTWSCSAAGQENFIKDLVTELSKHENVDGMMYWCPEEAGNGDAANWSTKAGIVIDPWLNRGLWQSKTETQASDNSSVWGHALLNNVVTEMVGVLNPSGIEEIIDDKWNESKKMTGEGTFNLAGQRVSSGTKGIVVRGGKKIINK